MDATYISHSHDFCKRLGSQNRLRSPEGLVSLAATFISSRNAPPQQGALRDETKTAVRLQRDPIFGLWSEGSCSSSWLGVKNIEFGLSLDV